METIPLISLTDEQFAEIRRLQIIAMKPALNTEEAAMYLGVAKNTLEKLANDNKLTYYKGVNDKKYFSKKALDRYMMNIEIKSDKEIEEDVITYCVTHKNALGTNKVKKGRKAIIR